MQRLQIIDRASARTLGQVRLVGGGKNDVVSALEALALADEAGLDLVLVNDKGVPPVVKIEDYKKLQYEAKKAKSKHQRTSTLKEIQLKVNISEHDLQTKVAAAHRFLERGDKVKVVVRLKGRERDNPERAFQLLDRLEPLIKSAKISRLPGPIATMMMEPVATK